MKRAVIYTRVSTNLQEKDGTSLDSQIDACRAFAAENQYEIVREFREVYSGGYLYDRPALSLLRSDVQSRACDLVIIYATDRLSRNLSHFAILLDEFERYGAALHFVTETFENTATGKFLLSAKGFAAELEREKIRERCMRGRRTKAENGTLSFKRGLYGYRVGPDGRSVDCAESRTVTGMFKSVLTGDSLRTLAARLNRQNVPTPQGSKTWWASSLYSILKNPAYCGRTVAFRYRHDRFFRDGVKKVNGSIITPEDQWVELPDVTPAIVSKDIWDAVQLKLQENRKTKRRTAKIEALLRGRVRCGTCGRLYSPVTANRYRAYVCTSKQSPAANCKTKMLGAAKAEAAVWEIADRAIRHPEELKEYLAVEPRDTKTELAAVNRSIDKLNNEIDKLIARAADVDDLTWQAFQKTIRTKRSEIEKLQTTRTDILREPEHSPDLQTLRIDALDTLDRLTHAERVTILDILNLSAVWDGETLKVNFYAQYGCKSNLKCLYKTTVAGR